MVPQEIREKRLGEPQSHRVAVYQSRVSHSEESRAVNSILSVSVEGLSLEQRKPQLNDRERISRRKNCPDPHSILNEKVPSHLTIQRVRDTLALNQRRELIHDIELVAFPLSSCLASSERIRR
jgi:hypothetical protein